MLSDIRYRLRALFRRSAMERELREELAFHIEHETEKLVRAGLSRDEASRRAHVAFGGVERAKELSRDARGVSWIEIALQDLRYASRSLRMKPGFTIAVVATLGLGLGANAAMFGIVDRLLFRPPAYLRASNDVHRIYLASQTRGKETVASRFEYTRYLDLLRWSTAFENMAAFSARPMMVGSGENAREVNVGVASATLFDFFDARPALGRFFSADEDRLPAGTAVAVLGWNYWKSQFGGRADVIGQRIGVGNVTYTIVGVAPEGYAGVENGRTPGIWIPITSFAGSVDSPDIRENYYRKYEWSWLQILARRKPGVSVEAASSNLTLAYRRSWEAERAMSPTFASADVARPHAILAPVLQERGPQGSSVARVATWVTGVALIVLLVACANVANLLLARSLRRKREIALRLALGVSRGRLVAQLLTESVLLALLGSAAGLLVAHWGSGILRSFFLPRSEGVAVAADARTLGFSMIAALFVGVITGLAPALQALRGDVAGTLKAGAREGTRQHSTLRTALVVLQGTLSVVLLVGAGLFVRSMQQVNAIRLGFDADALLSVEISARGTQLSDTQRAELARQLEQSTAAVPGVTSVSRKVSEPFGNTWQIPLFVPGIDSVRKLGRFTLQAASPTYWSTVGTRLLRGRGFTAADRMNAPRVAVVSDAMAKRLWPERDAIGQCIHVGSDTMPCATVVGIAENIKSRSLSDDPGYHYYVPIEQFHPQDAGLFVRVRGDARELAETVRRQLQQAMPGLAYVTVTPLRDYLEPQTRSWRVGASMFLAFGVLALVVAAVGLYSVIAYDVAQRTHELGVRIALGAAGNDILRLVVGAGVRFAAVGIVLGVGIALAAGRYVAPLLFNVRPNDPLVLTGVAGTLLAVAITASVIPALRASRVDPSVALRSE